MPPQKFKGFVKAFDSPSSPFVLLPEIKTASLKAN